MEVPINFSFQTDYRICWGSQSGVIQYHYSACMGVFIQNKIISEKSLRIANNIIFQKSMVHGTKYQSIYKDLHYSGKNPKTFTILN